MYRMKQLTSCPMHSGQKRAPLHPNLSRFDQGWELGKGVQWWWRGKLGFQSCWSSPCPTSGSYYDDPSMAQGSFSIFSKTAIKNHQQQTFVGITDFSEDFPEKVERKKSEQLHGKQRSSSFLKFCVLLTTMEFHLSQLLSISLALSFLLLLPSRYSSVCHFLPPFNSK